MITAKILSVITAIGILILILVAFGLSWKAVLIGLPVSIICGFIYYKLLKKIELGGL